MTEGAVRIGVGTHTTLQRSVRIVEVNCLRQTGNRSLIEGRRKQTDVIQCPQLIVRPTAEQVEKITIQLMVFQSKHATGVFVVTAPTVRPRREMPPLLPRTPDA